MVNQIIKRDGRKAKFSERRVREAISAAMRNANVSTYNVIQLVTQACVDAINIKHDGTVPAVEDIQDTIVEVLKEMDLTDVAECFVEYRKERTRVRETKSDVMKAVAKIAEETERDNANVGNNFSSKLLQIASIANKWSNLATMPKEFSKAHESGEIHIHDCDSYNLTTNCLQISLGEVLGKGFNTGYGTIRKPNSVEAAGELACILLQSVQNDMFGGQSFCEFDGDLAEYVQITREKETREFLNIINTLSSGYIDEIKMMEEVEKKVEKRVSQAMQGVCYNLNTMHSRAGSQVPFSSVNIGIPTSKDAALVCQKFLEEYDKGMGKGEQLIFPNIIYRVKKGVNFYPNDPYRYLTDLAIKVAAHRMNPTFRFIDCSLSLPYYKKGIIAATMGCRTDVLANINGKEGPASRGNIAPVSINIVRLAIEAKKDWGKFYNSLDKIMNLCDEQLMHRYNVLKKLRVKDMPFAAGEGLMLGSEGLDQNDSIEPILKQGTWGIGFIGLAETLILMCGNHHGENEFAKSKADEIMNFMLDKVNDFKEKRHLNYSLYGTPAEGLSGRFTKIDEKKYGKIERITDKGYYTNSFHVPVGFSVPATVKADLEAPYHSMCTGGHISYFEIDGGDLETKAKYIDRHLTYCAENTDISYVAYNFRIKYCKSCGEQNIKLEMNTCPKCNSNKLQGVSRVTGYMSLDERFTPGKSAERADRITHRM